MHEQDILTGMLLEETWLSVEQVASACRVDPAWLESHIEEGLFPQAECHSGVWRFSGISLLRAQRMRQVERDFDAVPELAALIADMQEEMDTLRAQLRLLKR